MDRRISLDRTTRSPIADDAAAARTGEPDHRATADRSALAEVWEEALDRLGLGCALVDRSGRILEATDGYRTGLDRLGAGADASPGSSSLEVLTRRILAENGATVTAAGREGTLLVRDGRPVGMWFRPEALDRLGRRPGDPIGLVVLAFTEADEGRLATLARVFGLTRREAEAALGVMRGETPAAIARALAVSIHTVRTHLARAYAKTGTAGRAELAATLNRASIGWMMSRGPGREPVTSMHRES